MGVYNPEMKMPANCMECPFLVHRHYDMPYGTFGDVWIKTCPYEPENKCGETEKHIFDRADWCVLEETEDER